jgi:hypothetical protein
MWWPAGPLLTVRHWGMRAATGIPGVEPRSILTVRVWLPAVLLVAGGSALLMSVNRAIGAGFCYGDSCTDQDMLADAAAQMYTSGIFVGHVCAYLIGGLVVARDSESRWARPVVAALAGFALAVVQVSVALPYAAVRLRADPLARYATDPTMLSSPGVWRAIVVSFLAYPLWAVLGLGIGRILSSRARLVGATLAAPVLLAWLTVGFGKTGPMLVLLTPMMAVAYLADNRIGFYTAGFLLCALAGLAVLANLSAARVTRRQRRAAAAGPAA